MGDKLSDEQVKEMQERAGKVAALRENLRSGRNRPPNEPGQTTDGTSEAPRPVDGIATEQERATFQAPRGKARTLAPTGGEPTKSDRRTGNNKRSAPGQPERVRRADRRDEKGSSGAASSGPAAPEYSAERPERHYSVGRLEADEIITEPGQTRLTLDPEATFEGQENGPLYGELSPFKEDYRRTQRNKENVYCLTSNPAQFITQDEYKQLRSREDGKTGTNSASLNSGNSEKPQFFKAGVLSKAEADELYEPLVAALSDGFGYVDKILWMKYPGLDEMPIWSNTTEKEDRALAKMLLKRGQKSAAAAAAVRTVVDSNDYVMIGLMLAPRVQMTVQAIRDQRRANQGKPKGKFTLFRQAGQAE